VLAVFAFYSQQRLEVDAILLELFLVSLRTHQVVELVDQLLVLRVEEPAAVVVVEASIDLLKELGLVGHPGYLNTTINEYGVLWVSLHYRALLLLVLAECHPLVRVFGRDQQFPLQPELLHAVNSIFVLLDEFAEHNIGFEAGEVLAEQLS